MSHFVVLYQYEHISCSNNSITLVEVLIDWTNLTIFIGDNLDLYIKRSHLASDKRNLDLHLFTSNIIFSRVATLDMSNEIPNTDTSRLSADDVLLKANDPERLKFMDVCCVLLCRILCQLPFFQKFGKVLPKHIPHEFSQKMAAPSKVMPMPIQFRNEAKHEDCLAIMDAYEDQITALYQTAFGKYLFQSAPIHDLFTFSCNDTLVSWFDQMSIKSTLP
jgi:hypothetical protein